MLESIIEIDRNFFTLINHQWTNSFLDFIIPYWREKTTWIPLYILLLIIVAKDRGAKTLWVLLILGLTVFLADQVSSELIKKTVERIRPCNDATLANVRELVHCGGGFSFTSSHACNHFAIVMQLFLLFRLSWNKFYFVLLFLWAAIIAYGQVYVGVHFPLDVFCGAILGCCLATLVYRFASWLGILRRIWS